MTDRDLFEQAFVAMSYLLGRRDDLAFGLADPGPSAHRTAARLVGPDQATRARELARELGPVLVALEARRFG
ncbi:MAG TPA: hypothetical protein VH142_03080 [Polyangiaceae bacterium]|jgi:hypothetical protein|nr:hypothetical protein [Polyangiaceae bacterium]